MHQVRRADDELALGVLVVDPPEEKSGHGWVISSSGWRTVVSGGLVEAAAATSSKPMTATSSGTRRPA